MIPRLPYSIQNLVIGLSILASLSGQAMAKTTDLGPLNPPSSLVYGNAFGSPQNQFYDDFLFNIPAATFSSITATINLGNLFGIDNLESRLYSGTITTTGVPGGLLQAWSTPLSLGGLGTVVVIDPITVGAGDYILEIRGDVVGTYGGGYAGLLNVSPVPEASTWALLLFGAGMIGFMTLPRGRSGGIGKESLTFA